MHINIREKFVSFDKSKQQKRRQNEPNRKKTQTMQKKYQIASRSEKQYHFSQLKLKHMSLNEKCTIEGEGGLKLVKWKKKRQRAKAQNKLKSQQN